MAFVGTITLKGNAVIVGDAISAIEGIGLVEVGLITQIGSDVADWSLGDVVLYDNTGSASFKENSVTYKVIDQETIWLKYVAAP